MKRLAAGGVDALSIHLAMFLADLDLQRLSQERMRHEEF